MELTQDYVNALFNYRDGFLYWKTKPKHGKVKIGDLAGCLNEILNRFVITINRKRYLTSRLIFLYHKGYLPEIVDHQDRNKQNDKIGNLRDANRTQNMTNRASAKNSSSQYLGVCWHKQRKKWMATISIERKNKHLGLFESEEMAALTYNNWAITIHGEFANLNIIP